MLDLFGDFIQERKPQKWDICPCGKEKGCQHPFFEYYGKGGKRVLFIRDKVTPEEDYDGKPLTDQEGSLFIDLLHNMGFDLFEDGWLTYASRCYYNEEEPRKLCKTYLKNLISELKPLCIVFLGLDGFEALKMDSWPPDESIGTIDRYRGFIIPDQEYKTWFIPLMSLKEIEDNKWDPVRSLFFRKDLREAVSHINKVFKGLIPWREEPSKIEILSRQPEIISYLKSLSKERFPVTFDYETTGLKPNRKGHDIICASFCVNGLSTVFLLDTDIKTHLKDFLRSNVRKVAQNIAFEDRWSRFILGTPVINRFWDTMLASHYLDNRGYQITGLKFQTYLRFGVTDYNSHLSQNLKSQEDSGTLGFNNIRKIPKKELLTYCGKDSLYEDHLFTIQLEEFKRKGYPRKKYYGLDLMFQGSETLSEDSFNGFRLDLDQLDKNNTIIKGIIKEKEQEILKTEEGEKWKKKFGASLNLGSDPQLASILYSPVEELGMGLTCTKKTKKENDSVDEQALELMKDIPFISLLLELRKLNKISGTYLEGWKNEIGDDPILRPFVHLHTARTFRSSMSDPNIQNVPVRDKQALKYTRSCIKACDINWHLLEADFKSIEVGVGACYHKDPVMLNYLYDKSSDMHKDMAVECYLLDPDNVSKDCRQGAKNKFVFPEFYGSYWKNVGPDLWNWSLGVTTKEGMNLNEYLRKKGYTEDSYVQYIKKVEKEFWGDRFRGYADWKESWWKEYQEKGYFDTLTGFRCQGILRKNEAVNYPIQGSAFHTLLTAKILTLKKIKERNLKSKTSGQIHDSGLYAVPSYEVRTMDEIITETWTNSVKKVHPWIIVPLEVEIEITPREGSWNQKMKLEDYYESIK